MKLGFFTYAEHFNFFKAWWHSATCLVSPVTPWAYRIGTIIPDVETEGWKIAQDHKDTSWGWYLDKTHGFSFLFFFLWLPVIKLSSVTHSLLPSSLLAALQSQKNIPPKCSVTRMLLASLKLLHSDRDRKNCKIKCSSLFLLNLSKASCLSF